MDWNFLKIAIISEMEVKKYPFAELQNLPSEYGTFPNFAQNDLLP